MNIKAIDKFSGTSSWYDSYKSVRKPSVRPGYAFDEGKKPTTTPFEEDEASIDELKSEAEIVCEGKGHVLTEWNNAKRGQSAISSNSCSKCGKNIIVIERPIGDERDIMGEAFLSSCI